VTGKRHRFYAKEKNPPTDPFIYHLDHHSPLQLNWSTHNLQPIPTSTMSTTSKSLASDAGRITIFPYVFKPTQGPFSFYANKTRTHTSFWGTYDWPFEMFDPLNRGKPKINTTAAENFINMHEMRHALYEHIAQDTIDENDFSNYAGFLMASSIINDEATTAIVKHRRDYVRAEAKRWSDAYGAPVKIVEPKTFENLRHVEVQLPQSLFVMSKCSSRSRFLSRTRRFRTLNSSSRRVSRTSSQ
jgi:hypothetical protein